MQAIPATSWRRASGGRASEAPAAGRRRRRHSSSIFPTHASARPPRASRGQNPGPSWPSRAIVSRPQVTGYSAIATATPPSGASRRRASMLLAQAELFDEPVERVHLARRPPAELGRPHVAVRREVPLLGELLPLRSVHRLLERLRHRLHPVGRRALPGHDAAELRQRDVEAELLGGGHVGEGGGALL